MKRSARLRRFALRGLLLALLFPSVAASAVRFERGDVLVALGDGTVEVRSSDGGVKARLSSGQSGDLTGTAVGPDGNLYVTEFRANAIVRFDAAGTRLGTFGPTFDAAPESIVFDNAGFAYVGEADGTRKVVKLDPSGRVQATFTVETEDRGSDWVDLAADQCTLFYTSEGKKVFRYDVCKRTQLPLFADGLPGDRAYGLRIRPNGEVLVADSQMIVRLSRSGEQVATYDDGSQNSWFALNLDPDGRSFWSADLKGRVARFDIATGAVLERFDATRPGGLVVVGELTAAKTAPASSFATSLRSPEDVSWSAGHVAVNVVLAAAVMLLIAFPAQLFNSTFESHYDELRALVRRAGPRLDRLRARRERLRWNIYAALVLLTAFLYGLLDPDFPGASGSLELLVGLLVGLLVTTFAFAAAAAGYMFLRGDRARLRVFPGSVPIAALCVAVSRLARFQPGYLYGVIGGVESRRPLSPDEEGQRAAVVAAWMLVVGLAAWLLRTPVHDNAIEAGSSFAIRALDVALVMMFTAAIEGVAFGLVPVRFLDGARVFAWRRAVWAVLFGAGLFLFIHVLLNPASGYLSTSPVKVTLLLFFAFGAVSVAFWGYFRFRPLHEPSRVPP